jgi:hypothetical protein
MERRYPQKKSFPEKANNGRKKKLKKQNKRARAVSFIFRLPMI